MEGLFPEIISYIFRFLSVSDRNEASLVCKKWYYASLDPLLQNDIIVKCQLQNQNQSIFRHKVTHICLGEDNSTAVSEDYLTNILSKCSDLKHLDLSFGNSFFLSGQFLADSSIRDGLKDNLQTVKELKLSCLRHMTDVSFTRIVSVLENIEFISLASNDILFHNSGIGKGKHIDSPAVFNFACFLQFVAQRASKLKHVDLSFTCINDQALEQFCQTPELHLEELVLKGCSELTDKGIKSIAQSQSQLLLLDFSSCQNIGNGKAFFNTLVNNMPQLHTLKARKCPCIGQCDIQSLANSTSLRVVDLGEALNIFENDLIRGLCNPQQSLSAVYLAYCPDVTDRFVACLCQTNPAIRDLDLSSCRKITDVSVYCITRNLTALQYLSLAYCHQVSDLGLLGYEADSQGQSHAFDHDHETCTCHRQRESRIFTPPKGILKKHQSSINKAQTKLDTGEPLFKLSNLTLLKSLNLSSCYKITDLGILEGIQFKELQQICLEHLPKLTDKSVESVVANNPSLESVSLSGCQGITDASVKTLCTRCPRLKTLNLAQNDRLSDRCIIAMADCHRLRHLDISFCGNLSYCTVMALERTNPRLKFQFRPHIIY